MSKTYKDRPGRRVPKGIKKMRKVGNVEKIKRNYPDRWNWRKSIEEGE